jgi:nucleotide-binding universal stress UspA family protein
VPDPAEFSSSVVVSVLATACARAGLSSEGAELVRIGENAIYRLADPPIVVRIARSADRMNRVRKELCIARWLADGDVPAIRVAEDIDQPLLADGYPVSFWRAVSGGDPEPTHVDLARLLACSPASTRSQTALATCRPSIRSARQYRVWPRRPAWQPGTTSSCVNAARP